MIVFADVTRLILIQCDFTQQFRGSGPSGKTTSNLGCVKRGRGTRRAEIANAGFVLNGTASTNHIIQI